MARRARERALFPRSVQPMGVERSCDGHFELSQSWCCCFFAAAAAAVMCTAVVLDLRKEGGTFSSFFFVTLACVVRKRLALRPCYFLLISRRSFFTFFRLIFRLNVVHSLSSIAVIVVLKKRASNAQGEWLVAFKTMQRRLHHSSSNIYYVMHRSISSF